MWESFVNRLRKFLIDGVNKRVEKMQVIRWLGECFVAVLDCHGAAERFLFHGDLWSSEDFPISSGNCYSLCPHTRSSSRDRLNTHRKTDNEKTEINPTLISFSFLRLTNSCREILSEDFYHNFRFFFCRTRLRAGFIWNNISFLMWMNRLFCPSF